MAREPAISLIFFGGKLAGTGTEAVVGVRKRSVNAFLLRSISHL